MTKRNERVDQWKSDFLIMSALIDWFLEIRGHQCHPCIIECFHKAQDYMNAEIMNCLDDVLEQEAEDARSKQTVTLG